MASTLSNLALYLVDRIGTCLLGLSIGNAQVAFLAALGHALLHDDHHVGNGQSGIMSTFPLPWDVLIFVFVSVLYNGRLLYGHH